MCDTQGGMDSSPEIVFPLSLDSDNASDIFEDLLPSPLDEQREWPLTSHSFPTVDTFECYRPELAIDVDFDVQRSNSSTRYTLCDEDFAQIGNSCSVMESSDEHDINDNVSGDGSAVTREADKSEGISEGISSFVAESPGGIDGHEYEVENLDDMCHVNRKAIQKPPTTAGISIEDLKNVFHLDRPRAEKELNLKRTTFSNLSRHYGISKWPFRTIRDARLRIGANERILKLTNLTKDKRRKLLRQQRLLEGVIALIYENPRESRDSNTLAVLIRIVAAREKSTHSPAI